MWNSFLRNMPISQEPLIMNFTKSDIKILEEIRNWNIEQTKS